jgi:esterase/lipase superfamily enzyme
MGNWALRHAVQALRQHLNDAKLPRLFDNIILAAADEDDDALEHDHKLGLLPQLARKIHVYYARTDAALTISDVTKFNPDRLGENGPRSFSNLSTNIIGIDCTDVDDTPSLLHGSHQYYRLAPEVLRDIRAVLAGQMFDEINGRVPIEPGRRYRLKRDKVARGEE